MLDKRVSFKNIPMTSLKIGPHQMYFVGEKEMIVNEVITYRDVNSDKWIAYFVFGDEICGFMTCGYKNIHIYILEAMKKMIIPTAAQLKAVEGSPKSIIARVLAIKPNIECGRPAILQTPSVIRAEFTREREKLDKFRSEMNVKIREEGRK